MRLSFKDQILKLIMKDQCAKEMKDTQRRDDEWKTGLAVWLRECLDLETAGLELLSTSISWKSSMHTRKF